MVSRVRAGSAWSGNGVIAGRWRTTSAPISTLPRRRASARHRNRFGVGCRAVCGACPDSPLCFEKLRVGNLHQQADTFAGKAFDEAQRR